MGNPPANPLPLLWKKKSNASNSQGAKCSQCASHTNAQETPKLNFQPVDLVQVTHWKNVTRHHHGSNNCKNFLNNDGSAFERWNILWWHWQWIFHWSHLHRDVMRKFFCKFSKCLGVFMWFFHLNSLVFFSLFQVSSCFQFIFHLHVLTCQPLPTGPCCKTPHHLDVHSFHRHFNKVNEFLQSSFWFEGLFVVKTFCCPPRVFHSLSDQFTMELWSEQNGVCCLWHTQLLCKMFQIIEFFLKNSAIFHEVWETIFLPFSVRLFSSSMSSFRPFSVQVLSGFVLSMWPLLHKICDIPLGPFTQPGSISGSSMVSRMDILQHAFLSSGNGQRFFVVPCPALHNSIGNSAFTFLLFFVSPGTAMLHFEDNFWSSVIQKGLTSSSVNAMLCSCSTVSELVKGSTSFVVVILISDAFPPWLTFTCLVDNPFFSFQCGLMTDQI